MAKIIINRKSEWMNRLRSIHVYIDGKNVGSLKNGSSEEFVVEQGLHTIECKIDWCSSMPVSLDVKAEDVKVLQLQSGMKYYWIVSIIAIVLLFINFFIPYTWAEFSDAVPMVLAGLIFLYLAYFLTIGRKKYLSLKEDTKNIFNT